MSADLLVWLVTLVFVCLLLTMRLWEKHLDAWWDRKTAAPSPWAWWLWGYPVTVLRMVGTWRRLCVQRGLYIVKRPRYRVLGDQAVRGMTLRPLPARLGLPIPTRWGLRVRVHLHPGQVPGEFVQSAEALREAWRVHTVRVSTPPRLRGTVLVTAIARDPLARVLAEPDSADRELLTAHVGRLEEGRPWVLNFRREPHWLITGATQSGKSSLIASLVRELAPQQVALVGIDCKGGLELAPFVPRLTALAASRTEAAQILNGLVGELVARMNACRAAGVRSVWELPDAIRPVPVVVLVDEVAELYLSDGTREAKQETASCGTSLLRLAQLGAALGVHLVIAGQRLGAALGPSVTALRAQLAGRVCHRVHDAETAEMTLGDLAPDAVTVAQGINEDEQGVCVVASGGGWVRARSYLTLDARSVAEEHAGLTPALRRLGLTMIKGGEGDADARE